jgi:hypothetical protein
MRLRKTAMGWMAASALVLSVAATPAMGFAADNAKPTSPGGAVDQKVLKAEKAAAAKVDASLEKAMAKINKRIANHAAKTGYKNTFGSYVDETTHKIVIQTDASADVVASLLGAEGKANKVVVKKSKLKDSYSRKSDVPSYWGGAGVTASVGTPWCSTGFTVQNSAGTRFQVTAGHCFSNGTNTYTENGGSWMGSVSGNGVNDWWNRQDMELIGGSSYWGYIYTGGVDSSTGLRVVGAGDPVVGYSNYCHSGRTTGENCGHTVTSVNAQVCTQTGCKSPVIAYTGGNMIQGGDSGSPFYVKDSTSVWARGINIASGGGTGYAEKWSRIAGRFGVSITTG